MKLADIARAHYAELERQYAERLLPSHRRALEAVLRCRTPQAGHALAHCTQCPQTQSHPLSCGHRNCPACQHHTTTEWLERQRLKLLPVQYFLVTFTLPEHLRAVAWDHQRVAYDALFQAAAETLCQFARNHRHLGAQVGFTAVLHTHNRRLQYHPHLHVVIPGGGLSPDGKLWRRPRYQYLFNGFALAKVFRAKYLCALADAGLTLPKAIPHKWVVHCTKAGHGEPALVYLSRYLYRGVLAERDIVAHRNAQVTFRFMDAKTAQPDTLTATGPDFLWRLLQHVLPRGFHRVRDYGFLHHNAKRTLQRVQLVLRMVIVPRPPRQRPAFHCRKCGSPMIVVGVRLPPRVHLRGPRLQTSAQGPPAVAA